MKTAMMSKFTFLSICFLFVRLLVCSFLLSFVCLLFVVRFQIGHTKDMGPNMGLRIRDKGHGTRRQGTKGHGTKGHTYCKGSLTDGNLEAGFEACFGRHLQLHRSR